MTERNRTAITVATAPTINNTTATSIARAHGTSEKKNTRSIQIYNNAKKIRKDHQIQEFMIMVSLIMLCHSLRDRCLPNDGN